MAAPSDQVDLLILGAGPAGLTAACWAAQYDISTRIVDQKQGRTPTGHADGIQSRTLEILDSFGLADRVLQEGVTMAGECYWTSNEITGNIECLEREAPHSVEGMRFGKALLNQGSVEQVLLDYLHEKSTIGVELSTTAQSLHLPADPADDQSSDGRVVVGVQNTAEMPARTESIQARYLMACDGAHSWTRDMLDVPVESTAEDSTWGVLDIRPITDFPDIRQSCAIQSSVHGCIMTIPREKELVRFYVYLNGGTEARTIRASREPARELARCVERAMAPYSLSFQHCDWWSLYKVRRQIVQKYRPHPRVFFVGDAAHAISPLGGQGMNVSMQDAYNLGWKLGAVITGHISPAVLNTYHRERHPVAQELLRLDSQLVHAYEEESSNWNELFTALGKRQGFMSGVDVTYSPSLLTSSGRQKGSPSNIILGRRIPSCPIICELDGRRLHLAQALPSNGRWRLLVFPGDLRRPERVDSVTGFAHELESFSFSTNRPALETIVIHSSPRNTVDIFDSDVFHECNRGGNRGNWRIFTDESPHGEGPGPLYQAFGIGEDAACIVLCRPDQHVSWTGPMDNVAGLKEFLRQAGLLVRY